MLNWFKKKQPASKANPSQEKELFELQAELLADVIGMNSTELFKEVQFEARKGIVYIKQFNIEIVCQVLNQQEHPQAIVYCLAFTIEIDGEAILYEEMAAIGTNPSLAIQDGVTAFNNGFFNGFLQSFFGHYEPAFELNGYLDDKFHLTYSQLQVQGAFREDDSLDHAGLTRILFPLIKDFFSQSVSQENYKFEDYYWIKIYLSRQDGSRFIGECRFNNQEWPEGLNALIEQDYEKWKKMDDFLAKKQFIFIKNCRL